MTGSTFQPKNTKQTYTRLQTLDYLVQTVGLDSTGVNTILGLLETMSGNIPAFSYPLIYQNEAVSNSPIQIGSSKVILKGYSFYNPNALDSFVKFWDFNHLIAPVLGTNSPTFTIQIPAQGSVVILGNESIYETSTNNSLWFATTTSYLSSGITAPSTPILASVFFNLG